MQLNASYKDIWRVGYPVMLGNAAHAVTQAVDTAFMARVGINDLNGTLLAGMTFFFLVIIALGFTRGTQILIARRTGEIDYEGVGRTFDHLLVKGILLTVISFAGVLFFNKLALPLMITSEEILEKSSVYLQIRNGSMPLVIFNLILIAFYTGIGKTKVITVATVVLSVANIVFDYLLIFGKGGFPEMGIAGASLATVIAELTGTIVLVGALFYRRDISRFRLFRFPSLELPLYRKMTRLSLPIVFQHVIGMGAWYLFFLMIEKIGEEELAISSVIKSLYMLIGIPMWGLGSAINTVVSNLLGQQRIPDVIPATLRSIHISLAICLSTCGLLLLLPRFFIGLYSQEILAFSETMPTLYVILVAMVMFSIGSMTMHAVMGIGDTQVLLAIEMFAIACYVTYIYLAVYVWGLTLPAVWMCEFIYWTIMPVLTIAYLASGRWKNRALRY